MSEYEEQQTQGVSQESQRKGTQSLGITTKLIIVFSSGVQKPEDRKMSPAHCCGLDMKCLRISTCWNLGCDFRGFYDWFMNPWTSSTSNWWQPSPQGLLGSGAGWREQFTGDRPLASIFCLWWLLTFCFLAFRRWATLFCLSLQPWWYTSAQAEPLKLSARIKPTSF